MNRKYFPFVVIFLATLATAVVRYIVIPEWSFERHGLFFVIQIVLMVVGWWIIRMISKWFDKHLPYQHGGTRRLLLQIGVSILFVGPLVGFFIYLVVTLFRPDFVGPQFIAILSVLGVTIIALMNLFFYNEFLALQWRTSVEQEASLRVQTAKLQQEQASMQFHHLKNQVNPHFLFNALTSLDGLIQTNPTLASEYLQQLSKVYRYVLENRDHEVVRLNRELSFIDHYISLLTIRFEDALHIHLNVPTEEREKGIVMVTLQMLIDNAIKHNALHISQPLRIEIIAKDGFLSVRNNKQVRKQMGYSSKQGLQQLTQLYSFLSPIPVSIIDDDQSFEVKMPLLP